MILTIDISTELRNLANKYKICIFYISRQIYWYFVWLKMFFLCEPVKWPQHRVQSPNIDKKTVSICPAYCNHRPGSRVHLGWWCTEQGWRWRSGTTQQSPAPSAEASTSLYTVASLSRVAGEDTAAAAAAPRLSRHHHRCVQCDVTANTGCSSSL